MGKYRIIIIDDENLARDLIKQYIKLSEKNLEVVAECENGLQGIEKITELNPDFIFLDIQMPKITGFEMLELLSEMPKVIFTTAFDEFAIKAFEVNALDYLLKPFSLERFNIAVDRAINSDRMDIEKQSNELRKYLENSKRNLERVVIKDKGDIHIIPVESIKVIQAADDYVTFYTKRGKFLKKQTMKSYEESLEDKFVRVHRSFILNIDYLSKINILSGDSCTASVLGESDIPVSKSGYKKLQDILNSKY